MLNIVNDEAPLWNYGGTASILEFGLANAILIEWKGVSLNEVDLQCSRSGGGVLIVQ